MRAIANEAERRSRRRRRRLPCLALTHSIITPSSSLLVVLNLKQRHSLKREKLAAPKLPRREPICNAEKKKDIFEDPIDFLRWGTYFQLDKRMAVHSSKYSTLS